MLCQNRWPTFESLDSSWIRMTTVPDALNWLRFQMSSEDFASNFHFQRYDTGPQSSVFHKQSSYLVITYLLDSLISTQLSNLGLSNMGIRLCYQWLCDLPRCTNGSSSDHQQPRHSSRAYSVCWL